MVLLGTSGTSQGTAVTVLGAGEGEQEELGEGQVPTRFGPAGMRHRPAAGHCPGDRAGTRCVSSGVKGRVCPVPFQPPLHPSVPSLWLREGHRENMAALLCLVSVWQHFSRRAASKL